MDVHPGDRAAACGGMMEPIRLEGATPKYRIRHRCMRCDLERVQAVGREDDTKALLALAQRPRE